MSDKIPESGVVLVDFWASWCGPCKVMSPIVDKVADDNLSVVKINVDDNPDLAVQHQIRSLPTFILFDSGKEIKRTVGSMDLDSLKNFVRGDK